MIRLNLSALASYFAAVSVTIISTGLLVATIAGPSTTALSTIVV